MEPENGPLEKEIPIGNHHFQVPAVNFWGCNQINHMSHINQLLVHYVIDQLVGLVEILSQGGGRRSFLLCKNFSLREYLDTTPKSMLGYYREYQYLG